MTKEENSHVRDRMISMILATDMSFHFSDLARLKGRMASSGKEIKIKPKTKII